jgi:hypothetical protein
VVRGLSMVLRGGVRPSCACRPLAALFSMPVVVFVVVFAFAPRLRPPCSAGGRWRVMPPCVLQSHAALGIGVG